MKNLGIFSLLLIMLLTACRDNIDDVTTTEDPYVPPIVNWTPETRAVDGSVTGFVVDRAGLPIADANVKMGNLTTTTDDYGHFFFNDVTLNARGTLVQVEKAGHYNGSRRFFAVEGQMNRVKIELISQSSTTGYLFDAAAGGTITTGTDVSITFPPNVIKKEDGTVYTGEVRVTADWMNPTERSTFDRMPGNLQGVNADGEEVVLGTYGMVAVELFGEAGEKLNIVDGNTATLSMPVPSELQANAPAEIPLWSYSEDHGIWVEESFATLSNGFYTGEVAHFSFWNCDYPYDLVEFTATIIDESGNPLNNYQVVISLAPTTGTGAGTGSGYTCPDGTITGLIPANEALVLEIYGVCGELLYTENIGPFSDDVDYGTIGIDASILIQRTITGELVDCDGATIQNGLVTFAFDNTIIYEYVGNEPFSATFGTCNTSSDLEMIGIDLDELLQSDPATISNTSQDVGQVSVCDVQLQNFISITVDDGTDVNTYIYAPSNLYADSLVTGGTGTALSYYDNSGGGNIYISVAGNTVGDYSNAHFIEVVEDPSNDLSLSQGQVSFDYFTFDEYGNFGESVTGTFGGDMINYGVQGPVNVTVTGTFNIIRQ